MIDYDKVHYKHFWPFIKGIEITLWSWFCVGQGYTVHVSAWSSSSEASTEVRCGVALLSLLLLPPPQAPPKLGQRATPESSIRMTNHYRQGHHLLMGGMGVKFTLIQLYTTFSKGRGQNQTVTHNFYNCHLASEPIRCIDNFRPRLQP